MSSALRDALKNSRAVPPVVVSGSKNIIRPFVGPLRRFLPAPTAIPPEPQFCMTNSNLQVRLARTQEEIEAAQALRYQVFYEEMKAVPAPEVAATGRDIDEFDEYCDHLLVIDSSLGEAGAVVGTYRLMRRDRAAMVGRFYTQDEFNIRPLLRGGGQVLELGRSCVAAAYRRGPTMTLLWRALAQYIMHYDVRVMFGCGSFHGTDVAAIGEPLSYLYYNHMAPVGIRPRAVRERHVEMRQMPRHAINDRRALAALPPLLRGYLFLGGMVGEGAVIDHDFNTIDVCIIVETEALVARHSRVLRDDSRIALAS